MYVISIFTITDYWGRSVKAVRMPDTSYKNYKKSTYVACMTQRLGWKAAQKKILTTDRIPTYLMHTINCWQEIYGDRDRNHPGRVMTSQQTVSKAKRRSK